MSTKHSGNNNTTTKTTKQNDDQANINHGRELQYETRRQIYGSQTLGTALHNPVVTCFSIFRDADLHTRSPGTISHITFILTVCNLQMVTPHWWQIIFSGFTTTTTSLLGLGMVRKCYHDHNQSHHHQVSTQLIATADRMFGLVTMNMASTWLSDLVSGGEVNT